MQSPPLLKYTSYLLTSYHAFCNNLFKSLTIKLNLIRDNMINILKNLYQTLNIVHLSRRYIKFFVYLIISKIFVFFTKKDSTIHYFISSSMYNSIDCTSSDIGLIQDTSVSIRSKSVSGNFNIILSYID